MTMFDKMRGAQLPDYYPWMWLDGYQPREILETARKKTIENALTQMDPPATVNISVEVKNK